MLAALYCRLNIMLMFNPAVMLEFPSVIIYFLCMYLYHSRVDRASQDAILAAVDTDTAASLL